MTRGVVAVFGASGRQGVAQVRGLLGAGYRVRAITRRQGLLGAGEFADVGVMAGDYNDAESLEAACRGVEAVFFTAPAFSEQMRGVKHAANLGRAAARAGVARLIFNTSSWAPDAPIGQSGYDSRLKMENVLAASGLQLTVFRPVLFMDNLLTNWAKPFLQRDNVFAYPHRPDLEANWIALADVAAFMVMALGRDDMIGERIVIGGPERLTPVRIAAILSRVLSRPIGVRPLSPHEFGALMYDLFKDVTDAPRDVYVEGLADFYVYNNGPAQPFVCEMGPVLARLPVALTDFETWAMRQDWISPPGGFPGG